MLILKKHYSQQERYYRLPLYGIQCAKMDSVPPMSQTTRNKLIGYNEDDNTQQGHMMISSNQQEC